MRELCGAVSARQWTRDIRAGCSTRPPPPRAVSAQRPSAIGKFYTPDPIVTHHGPDSWRRVHAWRWQLRASHSCQSDCKVVRKFPNAAFCWIIIWLNDNPNLIYEIVFVMKYWVNERQYSTAGNSTLLRFLLFFFLEITTTALICLKLRSQKLIAGLWEGRTLLSWIN